MRLTILVNGPDQAAHHDYAVLWLDTEQQRWSRESHEGIDLPEWGELHDTGSLTTLCAPGEDEPLCTLRGLHVDPDPKRQFRSTAGDATWSCTPSHTLASGFWKLQAVDRMPVHAESALFSKH
ncbi:hypothetical protein CY652_00225 [Burkholderia sp. WAC0059]|uniref:DUF3564 family protein n=1 Tax=Burkholderia sp. WAC0059 TaxID=2066022 RepID=UPI000C7EF9BE|nr:DUF3564 family protein [Burkholderia sp. WAC0059]PLZ04152.1 hypothetical protein CY652_00225 [Burkholderia sp. WAC0059]